MWVTVRCCNNNFNIKKSDWWCIKQKNFNASHVFWRCDRVRSVISAVISTTRHAVAVFSLLWTVDYVHARLPTSMKCIYFFSVRQNCSRTWGTNIYTRSKPLFFPPLIDKKKETLHKKRAYLYHHNSENINYFTAHACSIPTASMSLKIKKKKRFPILVWLNITCCLGLFAVN